MQGGMYWSLLSKGIGTLKKINPSVHIKGKNILNILTIAKYVIVWLPLEATLFEEHNLWLYEKKD